MRRRNESLAIEGECNVMRLYHFDSFRRLRQKFLRLTISVTTFFKGSLLDTSKSVFIVSVSKQKLYICVLMSVLRTLETIV